MQEWNIWNCSLEDGEFYEAVTDALALTTASQGQQSNKIDHYLTIVLQKIFDSITLSQIIHLFVAYYKLELRTV